MPTPVARISLLLMAISLLLAGNARAAKDSLGGER